MTHVTDADVEAALRAIRALPQPPAREDSARIVDAHGKRQREAQAERLADPERDDTHPDDEALMHGYTADCLDAVAAEIRGLAQPIGGQDEATDMALERERQANELYARRKSPAREDAPIPAAVEQVTRERDEALGNLKRLEVENSRLTEVITEERAWDAEHVRQLNAAEARATAAESERERLRASRDLWYAQCLEAGLPTADEEATLAIAAEAEQNALSRLDAAETALRDERARVERLEEELREVRREAAYYKSHSSAVYEERARAVLTPGSEAQEGRS